MRSQPINNPEDIINTTSIIHNYDVSVIMPFYKKLDEFKQALLVNATFLQRNGIEVIIVMDEDSQQEGLVALLKEYPFTNWKVVVNHQLHEWRNPTKAINVGIQHATKKYVMVCSPESEFYTDAIYLLRTALDIYPKHFAIGTVTFSFYREENEVNFHHYIPYGSIMAKKEYFVAIGGYDESLCRWGGDDDNIRARLEQYGIKKLIITEVKLIHREDKAKKEKSRGEKRMEIPVHEEIETYYPNHYKANLGEWGVDFNDVVYDWQCNDCAKELAKKYMQGFEKQQIPDLHVFSKRYQRIILVQSYNESSLILGFLANMSLYFDGIILLDDGSTDNTYEIAEHPKLLLKVQKKRAGFIDIKNRNILLDLASFFSSEWFCFMDTDERFDSRYVNFDLETADRNTDILSFSYVNIWSSDDAYNAEYPFSYQGIMPKMRMFRNIGHCQIISDKKRVHFNLMPYQRNVRQCAVLFKHYGMASEQLRKEKYIFYRKEDIANDQKNYDHMLNHHPLLHYCVDIQFEDGLFINKTV